MGGEWTVGWRRQSIKSPTGEILDLDFGTSYDVQSSWGSLDTIEVQYEQPNSEYSLSGWGMDDIDHLVRELNAGGYKYHGMN